MSAEWDTCGRWPDAHADDCEWYRVNNLPEAKRWFLAEIAAHPHNVLSNPDDIRRAEAECVTCLENALFPNRSEGDK